MASVSLPTSTLDRSTRYPAARSRFTATYAALSRGSIAAPHARPVTAPVMTPPATLASVDGTSEDVSNVFAIAVADTPIWKASVQPAVSYGGMGGPPGCVRRSGYFCASSKSFA